MRFPYLFYHVRVISDERVGSPVMSAIAPAIIGVIAPGGYDPIVPTYLRKVDVKSLFATLITRIRRTIESSSSYTLRCAGIRVDDEEGTIRVVPAITFAVEEMNVPIAAAATIDQEADFIPRVPGEPGFDGFCDV